MTTLFSSGFESGSFSEWNAVVGWGGSGSVAASAACFGRCGFTASQGDYGFTLCSLCGGEDAWVRLYLNPQRLDGQVSERLLVAAAGRYDYWWSDGQVASLILEKTSASGARLVLAARACSESPDYSEISSGADAMRLGQWHCVEWRLKHSGAPSERVASLWLDGLPLGTLSGHAWGPVSCIAVGAVTQGLDGPSEVWFDEVAVADERIGPIRGFRVYDNRGSGPVDYATPRAVLAEAAGTWTSDALAAPGVWRFGLRAFNEVAEESNLDVAAKLTLLASGAESPVRPNRPTDLAARAAAGGCVEIAFTYNATGEAAACTHFHVYAGDAADGGDYGSPVGSVPRDGGDPLTRYSFLTGPLADGVPMRFAVRAATSADVEDDGAASVWATPDASAPLQPATLSAAAVP